MRKALLFVFTILFLVACKEESENSKVSGLVFGTSYSIIYDSEMNYQRQFDSLFYDINRSMSTYIENSDISKINRNEHVSVDEYFEKVFNTSKIIYKSTEGAFDPTIGAVVNAWDFGPEGKIDSLDSLKIDSLMTSVGLDKVTLSKGEITKPKETYLDFNAIAKGYAVDVIAEFLEGELIKNYLVEIGGELRAKGINSEKQSTWRVGVDQPRFDGEQSILKAITLKDEAMATSGTYRKFKIDDYGNKYAHIIDTKTGYPSMTNLLSISVIAEDCMTADAYATAFKTMGIDKVKDFLKDNRELKVFLVFENDSKELETLSLNGFPDN